MSKIAPNCIKRKRNLLELIQRNKYNQVRPCEIIEEPESLNTEQAVNSHSRVNSNKKEDKQLITTKSSEKKTQVPFTLSLERKIVFIQNPIKNKRAQNFFLKSFVKLRGVYIFNKLLKEIHQFGLNSDQEYRERILNLDGFTLNTILLNEKDSISRYLFFPNSAFKKIWNTIIMLLIFYVCLGMPWVISFENEEPWTNLFIFESCVDLAFFMDIFITFNSAYENEDGILVQNRKKITTRYLKGLFFIDFISIFPFYLFDTSNKHSTRSNTFVRIFRIVKIIRIFRASKILKVVKHIVDEDTMQYLSDVLMSYRGTTRLISAVFLLLIFAHINSCLWHFFAKIDEFGPDTWVARGGFLDDSNGMLYLRGLYFTFTVLTTVGFGDIHAFTVTEMIACMLLMLFGIGFYSFVVGTLSSVVTSIDAKSIRVNSRLMQIEKFAKENHLNETITHKMKKFSKNNGEHEIMEDDRRMVLIGKMSKKIRLDIATSMFDGLPKNIFFFYERTEAFITDVVPKLNLLQTIENEVIYRKGEHATEMFFIGEGRVSFVFGEDSLEFKSMVQGSYFGEIELLEKASRVFTVVSEVPCKFLVLNAGVFKYTMNKFPDVAEVIRKEALKKKKSNTKSLEDIIDVIEMVEIRKEIRLEEIAGLKKIRNKATNKKKFRQLQECIKYKVMENAPFIEKASNKLEGIKNEINSINGLLRIIQDYDKKK